MRVHLAQSNRRETAKALHSSAATDDFLATRLKIRRLDRSRESNCTLTPRSVTPKEPKEIHQSCQMLTLSLNRLTPRPRQKTAVG
jgi:hypothetical protein